MDDRTNFDRADRAGDALVTYWGEDSWEETPTMIGDLVCDLMHLLDAHNRTTGERVTFASIVDGATRNHEEELADEGTRCDTCGNACTEVGCTIDPTHEVAL